MVVEEKGVASSGLAPQVLVYSLQVPWTLDTRSYAGGGTGEETDRAISTADPYPYP
jgi:hypothetical protein